MSTEADRLARVRLGVGGEPGHLRLGPLASRIGPALLVEELGRAPGDPEDPEAYAARILAVDAEEVLTRAAAAGMRFVVPGDEEWPATLDDLAFCPPLHERGGVPLGLWCRGPLRLDEVVARAVAIVGSRSSTSYGESVAGSLAGGLVAQGWTVVSGAAFGIDYAAHRGAVAGGGPTVAVLACGADRAYPTAHRAMLEHLAATGLIVSEAAPGLPPTRIRFLARNRLIAALAQGTVVAEAALRSGALNTASWTSGLGRVLMGVPGPVSSAQSHGVHQMLRNRDALLVTGVDDVLEVVAPMGTHLAVEARGPERPRDRLDRVQQQALEAVPLVQWVETSQVARAAGLTRAGSERALRALHALGFVEHADGRWRQGEERPASSVDEAMGA